MPPETDAETGFLVVWRDNPTALISTVAREDPVKPKLFPREELLDAVEITDGDTLLEELRKGDGTRYAVAADLARKYLGWSL